MKALFICLSMTLIIVTSTNAFAQWFDNGVAVFEDSHSQEYPAAVADGTGGVIIAWCQANILITDPYGQQGIIEYDIYAQRIDQMGNKQWDPNGVPICTADDIQYDPYIIHSGNGEFIIAWTDKRDDMSDIYVQKIDLSGNVLWAENGILPYLETDYVRGNSYGNIQLLPDGAGGAYVCFFGFVGSPPILRITRIDSLGTNMWQPKSMEATYRTDMYEFVSDGTGGVYSVAVDQYHDVHLNHMNPDGFRWSFSMEVVYGLGDQNYPRICSGRNHSVIMVWEDQRNGGITNRDIYAQRYAYRDTVYGDWNWARNGIPVCTAAHNQMYPYIVSDGYEAAIISWYDERDTLQSIYAQKVDTLGNIMWDFDGIKINSFGDKIWQRDMISDNMHGAIIVWETSYDDDTVHKLYAQRIDGSGNKLWGEDGICVCEFPSWDKHPIIVNSDSYTGEYIIAWEDYRHGYSNIYAQQIYSDGSILTEAQLPPHTFTLEQNYPNPFNPTTTIRYMLPCDSSVKLSIFDVTGREIVRLIDSYQCMGQYCIEWNGKNRLGNQVPSGIYFCRLASKQTTVTMKMVLMR